MRRSVLMSARSLVLLGSLVLATASLAADKVAPQASGSAKTPPPAAPMPAIPENAEEIEALKGQAPSGEVVTRRPARTRTPMMAEILTYLEERDRQFDTKRQQLTAAKADRARAAALQLELQAMKLETEIAVLRIQARYAVKEGRTSDAERIEASIQERLEPQVKVAPEPRPIPTSTGR